MNEYMISELAYKNGFDAGRHNAEIAVKVKLAYSLLAESHTAICASKPGKDDLIFIREDLKDVMSSLLDIQVKLGVLKREEDIK